MCNQIINEVLDSISSINTYIVVTKCYSKVCVIYIDTLLKQSAVHKSSCFQLAQCYQQQNCKTHDYGLMSQAALNPGTLSNMSEAS